ncbi:hypothetical protein [Pontibacter amylolyticus]|uniref:Uncharacterized protein n=1 Tax=Pontibacter amylolyticus TaxID=1424080 RepID=A0ABQ1WA03_9BACT|nr:hypothetical protein [Pontibacter amylolyticus]GGG21148.1 hypothetical protein GCM10011323_26350 [Pontibacter amylolyticus]
MFKKTLAGMCGLLISLAACQSPDNAQTEQTDAQESTAIADTTKREPRPKPEYYSFKGLEKKRVYICMDPSEDTFHQKHDCPVLISCASTFRNLTLPRAVEAFGRYNCETCSADLAYVFDENAVRMETGLQGQ